MIDDSNAHVAGARLVLKSACLSVAHEISNYPTPISGCDAQFNYLLARRVQIERAIEALDAAVFVPTARSPSPLAGVERR